MVKYVIVLMKIGLNLRRGREKLIRKKSLNFLAVREKAEELNIDILGKFISLPCEAEGGIEEEN